MLETHLLSGSQDRSADAGWKGWHAVIQLLVFSLIKTSPEALGDVVKVKLIEFVKKSMTGFGIKLFPECELQIKQKYFKYLE